MSGRHYTDFALAARHVRRVCKALALASNNVAYIVDCVYDTVPDVRSSGLTEQMIERMARYQVARYTRMIAERG